jgi:hypothetical protein
MERSKSRMQNGRLSGFKVYKICREMDCLIVVFIIRRRRNFCSLYEELKKQQCW